MKGKYLSLGRGFIFLFISDISEVLKVLNLFMKVMTCFDYF
ncbi:hypothetical protein QE422_002928 [Chryseobacterium sp. SORGH_AS 447]|nr:hypothetical protein [Chryseobacterium sp. SORGH_AS_0447]